MKCHSVENENPFSLSSYEDVSKKAEFILNVIEQKIMPPWPANSSYRSFINENILSKNEINTIKKWISQGKLSGIPDKQNVDTNLSATNSQHKHILSVIQKNNVEARENDVFYRFHVPDSIKNDIYISRFEFIPGNRKIVHHSELFIDTTAFLNINFTDKNQWHVQGNTYELKEESLHYYNYLTGWLPGEKYEDFPEGIAAKIPANSNFMFLIHYAPSPQNESDSSIFIFHESKQENIREYSTFSLHGHSDLTEGKFFIPAGQEITLHALKILDKDISAFAVLPHAHHLAKKMKAYAIKPNNDTIPLLLIDDWDFDWQFLYKFREYVKLPANTRIHFFVTFDNTIENPENPNYPPKDIHYSFDADQEMMEFFIYFVNYEKGDEFRKISYPSDLY